MKKKVRITQFNLTEPGQLVPPAQIELIHSSHCRGVQSEIHIK
jgi:hypothetical protein